MNLITVKLTTSQLVNSGIYIGHNRWTFNTKIKPYLMGYKHSFNIINLYYTGLQLKIIIAFLLKLVISRQNILIVNTNDYKFEQFFGGLRNIFCFDDKWIGGLLTNFKVIKQSDKLKSKNSFDLMNFMPSIVILFDTSYSKWALFESKNMGIPISAVLDTDSPFVDFVNYPIIGNNKSFESLYFYSCFFRNAIYKGIKKECLDVLKIS